MDSVKICHARWKDEDNISGGPNVTTYILKKCDHMPLTRRNKYLSNLLATFYIRNLNC